MTNEKFDPKVQKMDSHTDPSILRGRMRWQTLMAVMYMMHNEMVNVYNYGDGSQYNR